MAQQCKGITKAGTRCRITGDFENGYCRMHAGQARQSATKQATPPSAPSAPPDATRTDERQRFQAAPPSPPLPQTSPAVEQKPEHGNGKGAIVLMVIAAVLATVYAIGSRLRHRS